MVGGMADKSGYSVVTKFDDLAKTMQYLGAGNYSFA